jgi:putative phosphoesterase
VRPELLERLAGVDAILHAGDLGDVEAQLGNVAPFYAVAGNADGFDASPHPRFRLFRVGTKRVGLTHVALARGDLTPSVARWVGEHPIEALIFGHTHEPALRTHASGLVLFNPGACGPKRFTQPVSFGFLHVEGDGEVRFEHVRLDRSRAV